MNVVIPPGLIGDSLMPEAALYAHYQETGNPCLLWVSEAYRPFYRHNPAVRLLDERPGSPDVVFDCSLAFGTAHNAGQYFGYGFFPQVGLTPDPTKHRGVFRYHGPRPWVLTEPYVALVPFSRTCGVHTTGVANKTCPLEWWTKLSGLLLSRFGLSCISLGGPEDPEVPGSSSPRNISLLDALTVLREAEAVVTVETGLLHMALDVQKNIISLNAATPPFLCNPPPVRVLRSDQPPSWAAGDVVETLREALSEEGPGAVRSYG